MDQVSVDLQNCYGIKALKEVLDFKKTRAYALYAPNGVMKSSLAQTFADAANRVDSRDRIFPTRSTVRKIINEACQDIDGERVLVVLPYDPEFGPTEKTSDRFHLFSPCGGSADSRAERVYSPSSRVTPELAMAEPLCVDRVGQPLLGAKRSCPNGSGRLALCAFEENSYRAGGRCRCAGRVAVYLPRGGRSRLADHDWDHALQGLAVASHRGGFDGDRKDRRDLVRVRYPPHGWRDRIASNRARRWQSENAP
jgi:hypothetical protein